MKKIGVEKNISDFSFIKNGKYPLFLKEHSFFNQSNFDLNNKIFPKIGLPNTVEDCSYFDDSSLLNLAYKLCLDMSIWLKSYIPYVSDDDKKLIDVIILQLTPPNKTYPCVSIKDAGGVEIKLDSSICVNNKMIYKKGKSVIKIYNDLYLKYKDHFNFYKIEDFDSFRDFSKNNLNTKNFKIVFSSTGEDGYWDIATISMRGIKSCQSWNQPQSRALISSMTSKFTGVIYITSPNSGDEYGSKMIRRAVVRYAIGKKDKKPALILDNIYPSNDLKTCDMFYEFLHKKTNLPVIINAYGIAGSNGKPYCLNRGDYYVPQENTWKKFPLSNGEHFYMDAPIQIGKISHQKDLSTIEDIDYRIYDINDTIYYALVNKPLKAYYLDNAKNYEHLNGKFLTKRILLDVIMNFSSYYEKYVSQPCTKNNMHMKNLLDSNYEIFKKYYKNNLIKKFKK